MATDLVCKIDKHFVSVTDPRVNRGTNYDLVEMIFMALTATLCGAQGWVDIERFAMAKFEWFERFIPLEKGVPSHDTMGRVFARLDTAEFLTAMHGWVDEFASCLRGQGVAIDGKVEARALQATVTGWGQYEQGKADALRQVALPFFSHERCQEIYYDVTDGMVCAGYDNGGKNACFGDSGGPLVIPTAAAPGWKQVGIVSWGPYSCGAPQRPAVYTRVSTYQPWIQDCMADPNGRICAGWDAYEPDNTPAQAHQLVLDSLPLTLTISSLGDSDWFSFTAGAGQTYQFDAVISPTIRGDTILWLYDSDGKTALALGDSYRPLYDYALGDHDILRWQAPHDGTFYLQVESRWLGRRVDYQISGMTNPALLFLPLVAQSYDYWSIPIVEAIPVTNPNVQTLPALPTPAP